MNARILALATLCAVIAALFISSVAAFASSPPLVESESVTNVAATSATLEAQINPQGSQTTAYFQYGTVSCTSSPSSCTAAPAAPGSELGAAEGEQSLSMHVQGLAPYTTYHYRVVAVNAQGTEYGPDQTFATQLASSAFVLPDSRQWELVTPPEKHGAFIWPIREGVIQAAANGDAFTYLTSSPIEAEPAGYSNFTQDFALRGSTGWTDQTIATPHNVPTGVGVDEGYEYRAFSSDLSQGLVEPQGPFTALSSEATEQTVYLREDLTCGSAPAQCYRPLVTAANVPPGTRFGDLEEANQETLISHGAVAFVGSTPDMSHVVLRSKVALTSTPLTGHEGEVLSPLYEWAQGRLQLITILPKAEIERHAEVYGATLGSEAEGDTSHAISNDGSRIVWTGKVTPEDGVAYGSETHLYMRDMASGETVQLDALQGGPAGQEPQSGPLFETASSDGSTVFFTDSKQLSSDAIPGKNLYVCEMVEVGNELKCDLTDISAKGKGEELADVEGLLPGASEDGSYVYLVAGKHLYLAHDDGGEWAVTSIAGLSAQDDADWGGGSNHLEDLTARVSPNGRYLAFMSTEPLTGYDTRDAITGTPDEEVYLYDASTNKLVCASCNPTGARPTGFEVTDTIQLSAGYNVWSVGVRLAANIPGWTPYEGERAIYQSRYLSNNGRLFFNSGDALVPEDVNGTVDVYEYEPAGIGSCTDASETFSEHSDGCVDLISAGTSPEESAFLDASEEGADVFFMTASKLAPQDFDTSQDVYDAHECTTQSPCFATPPLVPPPCTTGDACKPAPTPQPAIYGAPSSETFSGAGNVAPSVTATSVTAKGKGTVKKPKKKSRKKRSKRKGKGKSRARKSRRSTADKNVSSQGARR